MAFKDYPSHQQGIELLQRSIERGRLGHAYLFSGRELGELEALARTLAKALNCQAPVKRGHAAVDSCDQCHSCKRIDNGNHPDIHWVRPESKSRIVTVDQMRALMLEVHLKPTEAAFKVGVVVAADRLRTEGGNAFLKTLEEPPPNSVLILLTTEPQRILETLVSRCLRLNFGGEGHRQLEPEKLEWITTFSEMAASEQKSLLGRYRLMDVLVRKLTRIKQAVDEALTARSPLQRYKDAEKEVVERWEDELAAAIEAEYRRQRSEMLAVIHWWLRDVWLYALEKNGDAQVLDSNGPGGSAAGSTTGSLLNFPQLPGTGRVAARISASEALENLQILEQLQRWLGTNVQEALALEVGLLKLRL